MQRDMELDNRNIVILNRGVEFVGGAVDHVLAYKRHEVKEIYNVVYSVRNSIPF